MPLFQEQLLRIVMVIANFTGGEAEELRRALGSRRSADKMKTLELKLRAGMDANGVGPAAQEEIVQSMSSFALYGFPESYAASFALIAYASAVLVKDAQQHGLRIKPVDVLRSYWPCTLEKEDNGKLSLRLGFR